MKIADIIIGKRIRREMGDLAALADSIKRLTLLQAVGVRPDNTLVCGERRIRACQLLGWEDIDARVLPTLQDEIAYLEAERDENTCRQPLTPAEALATQQALEPKYAARNKQVQQEAGERGVEGGRGKKRETLTTTCSKGLDSPSPKQSAPVPVKQRPAKEQQPPKQLPNRNERTTKQQAAKPTGYSAATLAKVAEIRKAADSSTQFASFAKELEQSDCKVDAVYKRYKAKVKEIEDAAAARKAMREIEKTEAEAKAKAKDETHGIYLGDFRAAGSIIPNASVGLIFTDPPYDRDTLPVFKDLAVFADRVLVDGGSLITFCGQYVLQEVIQHLSTRLRYFWVLCCKHTGGVAEMREYGIKVQWKPMLWFVKGSFRRDRTTWVEDFILSTEEKTHHLWQQSLVEAKACIEWLTKPGEIVVDPFCGGGTTARAAKDLGRAWATFDVNPVAVKTARDRITS